MASTQLFVKKLSEHAVLPTRGSALAAGWDLASAKAISVPVLTSKPTASFFDQRESRPFRVVVVVVVVVTDQSFIGGGLGVLMVVIGFEAHGKAIVPTDLAIATPVDCYARIAPRSGLAVKKFIDVGAGVVDADYRGAVGVVLFNHADEVFEVRPGDRIAQLILERVHLDVEIEAVNDLPETARGHSGFGSTGVAAAAGSPTKKPRSVSPTLPTPPEVATAQAQQLQDLAAKYAALQTQHDALLARLEALEQK